MKALVRAAGVGVRFLFDRQGRPVTPGLARLRRRGERRWGLRELSFEAGPGEGIALIGPVGAGKSSLLRAVAGVYPVDAGQLEVRGRVASLLAVDAGLMSSLTGRENAELLAVLAGLSRREARRRMGEIEAETGLHGAGGRAVGSFSQGARARLGFAAADRADPEILLLDEVHEAFDHDFRGVLERRARELIAAGGVVMAAGHDHPMLERLCSRALLLDEGALVADGPFQEVRQTYLGGRPEPPALTRPA
jgi:ABC-type polysaccharide/polyol phosphate transport system ATPase subunit